MESNQHTIEMKKNVKFLGMASMVYALVYTVCLYKNKAGITFPFFAAGSLLYYCLCMQKLGISRKKDSIFYILSILLLGISTFCTDDGRIIFMNRTGIFVLLISFVLHAFYDDSKWNLGKYLLAIVQMVFGSMGMVGRPFTDYKQYHQEQGHEGKEKWIYVLFGIGIALPLIMIVLLLLTSADAVFREMMGKVWNMDFTDIFGILFMLIAIFFLSYGMLAFAASGKIKEEVKNNRKGEPVLAITITSILLVIYVVFSMVQICYLFVGNMTLPEGYTYAKYAREGFFQLLVVCVMNVSMVLICLHYFRESKVLKWILTAISICTYVMIASSAMRMVMYIRYYYLTFLRIFVLWSLLVIFLLLTGIMIGIYKERFPLFRYGMAVITICYILLSFVHPDYWIAKCNLKNMTGVSQSEFFQGDGYEDYAYMCGLSADAVPAYETDKEQIVKILYSVMSRDGKQPIYQDMLAYEHILEEENSILWQKYDSKEFRLYYLANTYQKAQKMKVRDFNLSLYRAKKMVEGL